MFSVVLVLNGLGAVVFCREIIRKGIRSKYFLNRECKCDSMTKEKGKCAYTVEYRAYCVVYKVTCRKFISVYVEKIKTPSKIELNNTSKMWSQRYTEIKIKIIFRLILINILTKN